MFTSANSISATGTIQQKHEVTLKNCSVLLQGSYCPSLQQRVMGAINQLSLKLQIMHVSVLSLATVLRMHLLRANILQSPLFVLCSLIYFVLLPNRSSLPSLERSPFCALEKPKTFTACLYMSNDLGSNFMCTAHICHDSGSCHIPYYYNFFRQELPLTVHFCSA